MCSNLLIYWILMTYLSHWFISMIYLFHWLSCFIDSFHWFLRSIDWFISLIDLFHWFAHFQEDITEVQCSLAHAPRRDDSTRDGSAQDGSSREGLTRRVRHDRPRPRRRVDAYFQRTAPWDSRTGLGQTKRTGHPRRWQEAPTPNASLSVWSKSFPLPWSTPYVWPEKSGESKWLTNCKRAWMSICVDIDMSPYMYRTPCVHLLQFRDLSSARYKSTVGRIW